jgi:hypothetical protein
MTLSAEQRELADYIVERLADVLDERAACPPRPELVDARTRAAQLGVSVEYVRRHALELGARRIGGGQKPRLRFPAELPAPPAEATDANRLDGPRPRTRRHTPASKVRLLPIKGVK